MTRIATIALSIIALTSLGVRIEAPEPTPVIPESPVAITRTSVGDEPAEVRVRFAPRVIGATAEQAAAVAWALGRYDEAGLVLPPLVIQIHDTSDGCEGNRGIHLRDGLVDIIHLCDTTIPVVLHELAHAWTAHHTSDEVRKAFLLHEGVSAWAGATVPYDERGTERASRTMSLCLAERPLSDADALHYARYLEGYEILTGRPSPRLGADAPTQRIHETA